MDNNTLMAIYGGLAILVIFYFVVSFFSGKTWKVTHVLITVGVFFGAGVFLVMAAATLKTQKEWREIYLAQQQELSEQLVKNELIEVGFARDSQGEIQEQEDSIRELKNELGQELYDRALVWRGCTPGNFDGAGITVTIPAPADPADAADSQAISDRAILYAFKEYESPGGWKVPGSYVGEFEVTGKTGTSVTLKPTIPLDNAQLAEVQNRNTTWVLYDLMPVDSYYAFHDQYDPDAPDPEADFRTKMQQLMPSTRMNLSGDAYNQLIDQYVHDRRTADPNSDDPKRIWKKVRFLKVPDAIKVDSDEDARGAPRYYDTDGRAVPASLRLGEFDSDTGTFGAGEIEFDIGDIALLDSATADELIAAGVCEELEAVYIRELRDYAYEFHEIYRRMMGLNDDAYRVGIDMQALQLASTGATVHVTYRSGEQDELEADLKGFEAERDALRDYLAQLTAQWQQLRQDLSLLYRTNLALDSELARYEYNLARMINQQMGQAESTASSPSAPTPPAGS